MGTYDKTVPGSNSLKVIERSLYGSSRIGMNVTQAEMILAAAPSTTDFKHEIAVKQFEISNHLGNVLAVITDRKTPIDDGDHDGDNNGYNENHASGGAADNIVDFYKAQIISATDYSPFGVQLDGRNFISTAYRYGFNGMEKDDEVKGAGNSYDFGARLYDNRLGRFISIDPVYFLQPDFSSYSFAANSPILYIDNNGENPIDIHTVIIWKGVNYVVNISSVSTLNSTEQKLFQELLDHYHSELEKLNQQTSQVTVPKSTPSVSVNLLALGARVATMTFALLLTPLEANAPSSSTNGNIIRMVDGPFVKITNDPSKFTEQDFREIMSRNLSGKDTPADKIYLERARKTLKDKLISQGLVYENPGHHQNKNPKKTPLPENHEDLWLLSKADSENANVRWTKVGEGKKAVYYKFMSDKKDGTGKWHFTGSTEGQKNSQGETVNKIPIDKVPNAIKKDK